MLTAFRAGLLQRSTICFPFRLRSLPRGSLSVQPLSGRLKARLLPAHRKADFTRIPASCTEVIFIRAILRRVLIGRRLPAGVVCSCIFPAVMHSVVICRIAACRSMIRRVIIHRVRLRRTCMITEINYRAGSVTCSFFRCRRFLFFFPRILRLFLLRRISFLHFVHGIRLIGAVVRVRSCIGIGIRRSVPCVCIHARILFQRLQIIKAVSCRGCCACPLASRQSVRNRHCSGGTSCRADCLIRILLDVFQKAMPCSLVKIPHDRAGIFENPLRPFLVIGAADSPADLIPFLHHLADGALTAVRILRIPAALLLPCFRSAALAALFSLVRCFYQRFFSAEILLRNIISRTVVPLLRGCICVCFRLPRRRR